MSAFARYGAAFYLVVLLFNMAMETGVSAFFGRDRPVLLFLAIGFAVLLVMTPQERKP